MLISGIVKTTLIDFPGKVAATIFTRGCNLRCGYCHNSELVLPDRFNKRQLIPFTKIMDFLKRRVGDLDGVCISGGEPTLHNDLPEFLNAIKRFGYAIKLDTNGTFPERLEIILKAGLVDYVAMDIKAPKEKYAAITKISLPFEQVIQRSVDIIIHSGCEYEFRTTLVKPFLKVEDVKSMGRLVEGASSYFLQRYVSSSKQLDSLLKFEPFSDEEVCECVDILKNYVGVVGMRGYS